jgi:hypothetical protein
MDAMKTKSLHESLGAIEANIVLGQSAVERVVNMTRSLKVYHRPDHNIARIEQSFARIQELLEELEENAR